MKDIRRQVEQVSGAEQRFEAGRPMAQVVSAARRRGGLAREHADRRRRSLAGGGVRQVVADYVTLTKPKVQSLLLLTTVTTMYVAGDPSLALVFWTVLGGSLASGGAGAVNHWYDRDIDARMARTATRPVPSGRVVAAGGARVRDRAGGAVLPRPAPSRSTS